MRRAILLMALFAFAVSGCEIRDGKIFIAGGGTAKKQPKVDPKAKKQVRVLIVERTGDRPRLPGPQAGIFTSKAVRDYLNERCCKDDKGNPEWRFLDEADDVSKMPQIFQDTFKRSRPKLPWFYATDGKKGTEGPLPEDDERFLAILKPYCE